MKISNTNKKIDILLLFLILFILIIPVFVSAQIIPNCSPNCGYQDLLKLVNNIINWIIMIAVPVAAGVFAWAGFKLMTTGIADEKSAAKEMIWKVFIGLVFILAAWIIVGTIIKALLRDPSSVPIDISINKSINLYV
ncbi:MAG: hypothetical protein A3A96_01395 [Candidatus Zambryskibacteria bacterium RIFCSPLOWO2_01_FULL_39_39]|uniref:Uncharacterized protein n=2 Tax=Patescibacteria group TaxID=1783273 RepID=A0A1G2U1J6_9BACT|nr:MAG: hypothetical protein A2644_03225 [Candidatus Zambryskibacteria bacterium RIFCSPHIGHO2_01_FULL_39_63]OHA95254.1 MAG: hypothetical protein A3B88_02990 [Candidatus Zambryskibacteria bacterium RIFCSPHIGHO2_02_FULL_39_19]OHA98849.1 MAG: hypothetical protein A3F20_02265 [Candidatus Zambryskibacteria bacterium RIFCSPHIGHO2_12_FULL_39_21]OHB02780.1 MAG: hypothetical protein A3A96_01395 [Candidatus Zambryskibacteria bacterium RIFCSPLOWO2_01_FULL_39_39]